MIGLRQRLAISSGLGVAGLLGAVMGFSYLHQRRQAIDAGCVGMWQRQQLVATSLDQVFTRTEQRARELVQQIDWGQPNRNQLIAALDAKLMNDGESVQFGVFLPADNIVDRGGRFAISEVYDASGLHTVDFVRNGYDYWTKPWYRSTIHATNGFWSAPYFNEAAGGIDTVTYDYPLAAAAGRPPGMVSISLSLGRLAETAAELGWQRAGAEAYLLVDAQGRILLASDPQLERAYTLDSPLARRRMPLVVWAANHPQAVQPLQECNADAAGISYVQFAVPRVGWRVASAIDNTRLLAPLRRALWLGLALAVLLGALVAALFDWGLRRLRRPLRTLTASVERFGAGQYDHAVPPAATLGEFAGLGVALEQARQNLLGQRGRAREERDARLREEGRQRLAVSLQRAQLPADRVVFGRQLQAQACGGLREVAADGAGFYGIVPVSSGVFVAYLGGLRGEAAAPLLQLGRITAQLALLAPTLTTPADLLAGMAQGLERGEAAELTLELLVARVELDTQQLCVASAGTAHGMLLHGEGPQLLPLPAGPCVQRGATGPWPMWQGAFAPGERLLLLSESMREAAAPTAAAAMHQLQVIVERHADLPVRAQLDATLDELAALAPQRTRDLLAVLLELRHRD